MITYQIYCAYTKDLCDSAIIGNKEAVKFIGSFESVRSFSAEDIIRFEEHTYKVERFVYEIQPNGRKISNLLCTEITGFGLGF